MENKVLINLMVPELEKSYNVYLPISKRIGNIIFLLIKAINEMGDNYEFNESLALFSRMTGEKYNPNSLVIETNIRNGSEIVLL